MFTVRVELRNRPTGEDYETLHKAMAAENFSRTIKPTDRMERLHLPTAEYNFVGTVGKEAVLTKAKRAAAKTSKVYSILVTKSGGRTWYNLDKA